MFNTMVKFVRVLNICIFMASHEMVVRSGRQLDRAALSGLDFHPDRSPVKVSCYVQANHPRFCLNGEHEKACPATSKTEDVPTTWGMGGATNRMCQKVLMFFLSATLHCILYSKQHYTDENVISNCFWKAFIDTGQNATMAFDLVYFIKQIKNNVGTSLVVQWLRLWVPM